jgi:hypothetical protein
VSTRPGSDAISSLPVCLLHVALAIRSSECAEPPGELRSVLHNVFDDVSGRAHVAHHPADLPGRRRVLLPPAGADRLAEVLPSLTQFGGIRAAQAQRLVVAQGRGRERPHRLAREQLRDQRLGVARFEEALLVSGRGLALGRRNQSRAELDATGPESQRRQKAAPVGEAARGHHRHVHRVDDLGQERQCRHRAHVAARLAPGGDDRIGSLLLDAERMPDARNHGKDQHPGRLEHLHDRGPRIAAARRHDRDPQLDRDLRSRLREGRAHRRDVHSEGEVRKAPRLLDVAAQLLLRSPERRQDAQPARFAHRRNEARPASPLHRSLQDRMADAEQVAERSVEHARLHQVPIRIIPRNSPGSPAAVQCEPVRVHHGAQRDEPLDRRDAHRYGVAVGLTGGPRFEGQPKDPIALVRTWCLRRGGSRS